MKKEQFQFLKYYAVCIEKKKILSKKLEQAMTGYERDFLLKEIVKNEAQLNVLKLRSDDWEFKLPSLNGQILR